MPNFTLTFVPRGDYIAQRDPKHRRCTIAEDPSGTEAADLATFLAAHGVRHAPIAPVVPATLTPAQLRLQLAADGKSALAVEDIIAHLPDPMRTQAAIMFDYSLEYHRSHPLLIQLAGALGYDTAAKLDAFFLAASKL